MNPSQIRASVFQHVQLLSREDYISLSRRLIIECLKWKLSDGLRNYVIDVLSGVGLSGLFLRGGVPKNKKHRHLLTLTVDYFWVNQHARDPCLWAAEIHVILHPELPHINPKYLN